MRIRSHFQQHSEMENNVHRFSKEANNLLWTLGQSDPWAPPSSPLQWGTFASRSLLSCCWGQRPRTTQGTEQTKSPLRRKPAPGTFEQCPRGRAKGSNSVPSSFSGSLSHIRPCSCKSTQQQQHPFVQATSRGQAWMKSKQLQLTVLKRSTSSSKKLHPSPQLSRFSSFLSTHCWPNLSWFP